MFVVFDLDGTLADGEHREHYLHGERRDWTAFFAACDQDKPKLAIVDTMKALIAAGHRVEIWTGRSDEVADKTSAWLERHDLPGVTCARGAQDRTQDDELKARWMAERGTPDLVFEDRARVVAMWRAAGVTCCQVAPGDF